VSRIRALKTIGSISEGQATCQTRTDDLRFTKPLLYQLS
jgi:hypothetical protein